MPSAQRIARAGPSNTAKKPSPAVSISSPAKRSSSRRTTAWCCSTRRDHAESPSAPSRLCRADDVGEEDRGEDPIGDRRRPGACEELLDLVQERLGVDPGQRARSGQLDQPRAGNRVCELACLLHPEQRLVRPVNDERRRLHEREGVADVGDRHRRDEVPDGAGTAADALPGAPPCLHHVVGIGRKAEDPVAVSPVPDHIVDDCGPLHLVEVVDRRRRERAVEGDGAGPLRVRRREEDRHRPSLVVPEQRRSLGAHGVHHRAHVVHPRLQVGNAPVSVREAGTALVQTDEARERGQPLEEGRVARLLPVELEVAGESGHEDEVERPVARHLVGDRDVAALRIANRASHGAILAQAHLCPPRAER